MTALNVQQKFHHRSLIPTNIVLFPDPNRACLKMSDETAGHRAAGEEVLGREPAAVAGTLP